MDGPLCLPPRLEFLADGPQQDFDGQGFQNIVQAGTEEMHAVVVAGKQLASVGTNERTATGNLLNIGWTAAHEQIDQQKNVIVSLFNPGKTATAGSFGSTAGTLAMDAHLPHQLGCPADSVAVLFQQTGYIMVCEQPVAVLLEDETSFRYCIEDAGLRY
jgi:hypothetical protein